VTRTEIKEIIVC